MSSTKILADKGPVTVWEIAVVDLLGIICRNSGISIIGHNCMNSGSRVSLANKEVSCWSIQPRAYTEAKLASRLNPDRKIKIASQDEVILPSVSCVYKNTS